ncbi:DUF7507 domain-containing protein [Microlunatus antarcticus]|uniref:Uncharacterized protein n=1 Tax=Microlunatus antarcticus TaxID=53388 RepID=A0A7W5JYK8_9ACTN|nr:hypothetical protein [Microlunatus antarcticus]MBB3328694.1 hypothetical protein [Microlunatus antarcticus]
MQHVDPRPVRATTSSRSAGGVPGRTGLLLLAALLALAVVLGLQVAHPSSAAAASGPTVVDGGGTVSVSTYEVLLPGARDDVAGSSAIKFGLTAFTAAQPAPLPAGSSVSEKVLFDSGFGTWKIAGDGRMTFDTAGVTGTRSVRYRITDAAGLTAEGLQTVVVTAGAGDDRFETTQGRSLTLDLLANDKPGRNADGSLGTLDRSSLRFRAAQGAPVTVSSDGLVLTFPKIGVFTIDPRTRLATFAPDVAYVTINDSYALYYTAQDTTRTASGATEHHVITGQVRWTVTADRLAVSERVSPDLFFHVGDTITWTTTITNAGTTPVAGLALTHSLGARILTQTCTPVALGSALPPGSSTTCTATSRANQRDLDAEAATISDTVVATGTTTQGGQSLPLRAHSGSSTASRITQGLTVTGTASPATVTTVGQRVDYTFAVRNRGNRSVKDLVVGSSSPGVSALVCAPVALGGTLGDNRTTTCTASRIVTAADLGATSLTATAKGTAVPVSGFHATAANGATTVTVPVEVGSPPVVPAPVPGPGPTANADTASTSAGGPVVVDVLTNDRPGGPGAPLVASSVRLRTSAALPAGSALYGDAKTLKVAGRGVFLVSGTGQITFVPLGAATGPVPMVGYQVADANGATARATLAVTVG